MWNFQIWWKFLWIFFPLTLAYENSEKNQIEKDRRHIKVRTVLNSHAIFLKHILIHKKEWLQYQICNFSLFRIVSNAQIFNCFFDQKFICIQYYTLIRITVEMSVISSEKRFEPYCFEISKSSHWLDICVFF